VLGSGAAANRFPRRPSRTSVLWRRAGGRATGNYSSRWVQWSSREGKRRIRVRRS
jgi:hypothetical protein